MLNEGSGKGGPVLGVVEDLSGSDFAELPEVEHHFTLGVGLEGGDEAGSPHHFLKAVGVANVDRLEKVSSNALIVIKNSA